MKRKKTLNIGDFVMRDNNYPMQKDLATAKGIVISRNYYMDIDSMVKTPVSREEALSYGQKLQMNLPTKRQLDLITKNMEKINQSLHAIGRGDYMLFYDMQQDFWTVSDDKKNEKERRRVVFIAPL